MVNIQQIEVQLGIDTEAAILQKVKHPSLQGHPVSIYMKREDLIHPVISGNKWRKLKYNLLAALEANHDHLVSMGGPYSNHLHALAYVGHKLGVRTTGIIRGEQPEVENPTLSDLRQWGMRLEFVQRDYFRRLRQYREPGSRLNSDYHGYWITEGAANRAAMPGIVELLDDIDIEYGALAIACGTGTTLAGLANVLPSDKSVMGFAALKGAEFLERDVKQLLRTSANNWQIHQNYHFGGFAKTSEDLLTFIDEFQECNNIPVDTIYNGKMLYGLFHLIKNDCILCNKNIIAIHTGGLQGNRDSKLQ